jgi:chromosome segregation ATPase
MRSLVKLGGGGVSLVPNTAPGVPAPLETLSEFERLAAERRARAESVLARARELEEELSAARSAITPLIAASEAARVEEREAAERVRAAREEVAKAQSDLDAALRELEDRRASCLRTDADLNEIYTRLDAISKSNGLDADAAKRVAERRQADELRRSATEHG